MSGLGAAVDKMRAEGLGDAAVESFARQYERLRAGETGTLAEADIAPVAELPDADELTAEAGPELLDQAVVIKLNGGLGTSMGMTKAKSLLEVKDGKTFLDLIAEQILALREASGARLPLILMNSFATRDDSLAALAGYDALSAGLPPDFVQNKVPKVEQDSLEPVAWPDDPALEWAPPGHGDLYTALVGSGLLRALLDEGYRYAFVSNSDNLGAVLDPRILAWLAEARAPFLMEVADRTSSDRKGGHLARRKSDGGLVLREIAQTLSLHESTISRVTTQKYMATPRGTFELKYFFGSHVATEAGGAASSTAIRALIKQLVSAEDAKAPLSDARISQILGEQGIVVARRTIAKYRESLQIPPVNQRKAL